MLSKRSFLKTGQYHPRAVLLLLFALLLGEREARAYTDPSSAAAVWQILVAGFIGAMFYARRFFTWLAGRRKDPSMDE